MSRKYLILLIITGFVNLLIGCHAGGSAPFAPNNGETVVLPETRTVTANGRFTDITFPSGAVIKCPNDNTFQEGVKVTATEEKVPVITDNSGKYSYIYVYNISAVLPSNNSLTADVPVNTIEKPLSVTLPNDSTTGTCYIGTRANESDPWHYSLVTDGITSNARNMRLSDNPPRTCTFDLYRLNIQFRLFIFDNEEKKDEVQVDAVTLAPADDVEIKDGKYTGKLSVKLNIEGENLNDIKAADLIAKIIYRSENPQGANIDFATNKTDSSDKAVTGSYEHSFEITNIKIDDSLENTAELSFELNLEGVSIEDFPKDFLVEFYSKGSSENTRPFEYTQAFGFETKEPTNPVIIGKPESQPVTTYIITYNLGGAKHTGNNPTSYDKNTDDILLSNPTKEGYNFIGWTGSNGNTPQTTVVIEQGSTGDRTYTANFNLLVTMKIASDTGAVFEPAANNLYKFSPTFTITPSVADGINLNETEKANILSALSVKDSGNNIVSTVSKNWNNGNIALSFSQDLCGYTTYTISFGEAEGVTITCTPLSFTTFYFKGGGTNGDPYLVENAAQLDLIRNNLDKSFKQMDDIDLSGIDKWIPIGDDTNRFTGYYDGNNKKIKNLTIHSDVYMDYAGLFGVVSGSGKIENLTIDGVSLRGSSEGTPLNANFVGLIACRFDSSCSITNCHLTDSRYDTAANSQSIISVARDNGDVYVGGICADSFGEISNCSVGKCQITNSDANDNNSIYIGGICAYSLGEISNCSIGKCQITNSAANAKSIFIGGICANISSEISNCDIDELIVEYSATKLTKEIKISGICAYNSDIISNCSIKNTSLAVSNESGSLFLSGISSHNGYGIEKCNVQNSSVIGKGDGSKVYIGGISSCNEGVKDDYITNCYVSDSVIESNWYKQLPIRLPIGGIAGTANEINSCYIKNSTVKSNGYECSVGGIAGTANQIKSCYIKNSIVKSNGDSCYVGGICGGNSIIYRCYVTDSEITEASGNNDCMVGGINGYNIYQINSVYVKNTNIKGNNCVGGICGYMSAILSSCYVFEDGNHSISKIDSTGEGRLGCLTGLLYKNDSNPSQNAKIVDAFYNKTATLSDLIGSVGNESSYSATPDNYSYVTNCYSGIEDSATFNDKTWSHNSWYFYKTINDTNWPPVLDQN